MRNTNLRALSASFVNKSDKLSNRTLRNKITLFFFNCLNIVFDSGNDRLLSPNLTLKDKDSQNN